MPIELIALAGLLAAAGMIGLFIRLEVQEKRHVAVQMVLIALLLEIVLQPDGTSAQVGLLRLPLGPFDARPADVIVPLALAARSLGSSVPRTMRIASLLWLCFLVWYVSAGAFGILNGNASSDVIAQIRGVMIGSGLMVLVAGIDPRALVAKDRLQRAGRLVGVMGAILLITHFAKLSWDLDIPVVPIRNLGALDSDARTLFPILGVMAACAELASGRRRFSVILPAFALLATPVAATQGGPYLSLLVMLAVLTVVATGPTWKRRMNLTAADIGFVLSIFLIVGAVSIFSSGGSTPVFVDQFEEAVLSDSQATTTGERFQLWSDAGEIIAGSPVWGDGLGVFGTIDRRFPNPSVETTFHNVALDIAARSGAVGVLIATAALAATMTSALAVWREHDDAVVASVAMTSMLGLLALFGRAQVASSLEHTRITVAFFLLVGLVLACANSSDEPEPVAAREAALIR